MENGHKKYPESPFSHRRICYHLLIGSDGTVEKNRTFDERPGCTRHKDVNDRAIQVVLAGNFNLEDPSAAQIASLRRVVAELRERYDIPESRVRPHKDASSTRCPGDRLMDLLWGRTEKHQIEVPSAPLHVPAS